MADPAPGKAELDRAGWIVAAHIQSNAVETAKIKDANVTTAKIEDGGVTAAKLAADSVETAKIKDANVTLAKLASGITPAFIIVYAGEFTWTGGGTSKAETVTGALASDIVIGSIQSAPSEAAYLKSIAVTADTVTATLSAANTSNDAVISYVVLRAAS